MSQHKRLHCVCILLILKFESMSVEAGLRCLKLERLSCWVSKIAPTSQSYSSEFIKIKAFA